VQHSLDHSTTEAFGAYLESWGKTDFSERVKGNQAAVKVIAGEPSYLRSNFQRGVKRLPVAWAAR
jgi:hypothetical protein